MITVQEEIMIQALLQGITMEVRLLDTRINH